MVLITEQDGLKRLIHEEPVVYPELARQARVQGTVSLQVTVDTEGKIYEVLVESAHPLLASAAREAVLKYHYAPFLLAGTPRPFRTVVQVRFALP
jgi:protein TonB